MIQAYKNITKRWASTKPIILEHSTWLPLTQAVNEKSIKIAIIMLRLYPI